MGVGRHKARDLLHRDKLIFFKKWVKLTHEYEVMPPTGHAYEVFRIRKLHLAPDKMTRIGDGHDIFFHQKNLPTQHVTMCSEGEALVKRWLKTCKAPKPKDHDPHFEERFVIFSQFQDKEISIKQFRARMKDAGMSEEEIDYELDHGTDDE